MLIAATATGLIGGLAGCVGGDQFPDADIIAGPDGRSVFEPAELSVSVGEPVRWGFASKGHNLSGRPADNDLVELPADAEPFSSYEPGESPERSLVPRGDTYEHTFETAGEYTYVCIPHAAIGMVGHITVE